MSGQALTEVRIGLERADDLGACEFRASAGSEGGDALESAGEAVRAHPTQSVRERARE